MRGRPVRGTIKRYYSGYTLAYASYGKEGLSSVSVLIATVANGTKRQIAFWMPDGRFRGKAEVNERAASIASVVDDPKRSFEAFNSTCLSALVTDWAMEAWYHPSIHE